MELLLVPFGIIYEIYQENGFKGCLFVIPLLIALIVAVAEVIHFI